MIKPAYTIPCEVYTRYQYGNRIEKKGSRRVVMARETATMLIIEGATPGTERRFYKNSGCEVGFQTRSVEWLYIERQRVFISP